MPLSTGILVLIKDRDAHQPTVTEWRAWLATMQPTMDAFFAAHPRTEQAMADWKRYGAYRDALARLNDPKQSDLVKIEAQHVVDTYLSAPVSQADLIFARAQHVEPKDGQPSVVGQWKYYKGVIEDAKQSDVDKAARLAAKDLMCYKRGDFVELYPPGTAYNSPCAEPFYLLDVTGVVLSVAEIKRRYEQSEMEDYVGPEGGTAQRPKRRRLYYVNLDTLPQATKNALSANRVATIAWNKLRSSVKNKVTGRAEG